MEQVGLRSALRHSFNLIEDGKAVVLCKRSRRQANGPAKIVGIYADENLRPLKLYKLRGAHNGFVDDCLENGLQLCFRILGVIKVVDDKDGSDVDETESPVGLKGEKNWKRPNTFLQRKIPSH